MTDEKNTNKVSKTENTDLGELMGEALFGDLTDSFMSAPEDEQFQETSMIDRIGSDLPTIPDIADSLSEDELARVDAFAEKIDIMNNQQVMTFGAGAQRKMSTFSEQALDKVRTQDLGDAGDLIVSVIGELKGFDIEEKKGILGFFKKKANQLSALKTRYDAAEKNIGKITQALEVHQLKLLRDSATFDKLYEMNLTYFKELSMYLLAGRKKLEEIRDKELPALAKKAQNTGTVADAEEVQRVIAACNRFEKKLMDLDLSRTVSMQMAPQIRFVQNNEMLMIEKIQTTLVNTIPLWKSQMVLALGLANNENALRAQQAVSNMTNELLRKNSEKLRKSTVEVAKETERGIIDIETLRATNENLIKTFDEVMQIQADGRQKRAAAESEIRRMEGELRQKLLEVR